MKIELSRWLLAAMVTLAMSLAVTGVAQAEDEPPKPAATVEGQTKIEHFYSVEDLVKAAADADEATDDDEKGLGYKEE